jgi:hypothetical protein
MATAQHKWNSFLPFTLSKRNLPSRLTAQARFKLSLAELINGVRRYCCSHYEQRPLALEGCRQILGAPLSSQLMRALGEATAVFFLTACPPGNYK